jgi:membrane dipeptidase
MIIDLHLDLAMCALEWNRDLRLPVHVINERERGLTDKPDRGRATVSLQALRQGGIGLVVATQIARFVEPGSSIPGWNSPEQAWAQTQGQLAWYRVMEDEGWLIQIRTRQDLEQHLKRWEYFESGDTSTSPPIGYILSLEGADSLVDLKYLDHAYRYGLRAVGPAHYGPGRYANGTNATGKMGHRGLALLREMDRLEMILDATHLCDDAFWQALDVFHGPVWASHNLCRSIVPHNRQFSDEQISKLIKRGAIIGAAFDAWMIVPNWVRGTSTPENMDCSMEKVADHIDHICQIAGNARHVAIGTDLDGGYGREQCPYDLETIADIRKLRGILKGRGYSEVDLDDIFMLNALAFLRNHL